MVILHSSPWYILALHYITRMLSCTQCNKIGFFISAFLLVSLLVLYSRILLGNPKSITSFSSPLFLISLSYPHSAGLPFLTFPLFFPPPLTIYLHSDPINMIVSPAKYNASLVLYSNLRYSFYFFSVSLSTEIHRLLNKKLTTNLQFGFQEYIRVTLLWWKISMCGKERTDFGWFYVKEFSNFEMEASRLLKLITAHNKI